MQRTLLGANVEVLLVALTDPQFAWLIRLQHTPNGEDAVELRPGETCDDLPEHGRFHLKWTGVLDFLAVFANKLDSESTERVRSESEGTKLLDLFLHWTVGVIGGMGVVGVVGGGLPPPKGLLGLLAVEG